MIVFLIDADNLSAPAWVDEACQRLDAGEGCISVRRAYGSAENLRGLADVLRTWAIRPFVNLSLSKNTTDIALAVDAMELACQTPQPTVVAVGSGDADFLPLVVRLRERGIRMICVSVRGKMAQEAAHAYDKIVYVGKELESNGSQIPTTDTAVSEVTLIPAPAKKAVAKKAPAKKVATSSPPVKPSAAKKAAAKKAMATPARVSVKQILEAAPALKTGQVQRLGDIAKLLHDAKLLGKNATSTKVFNKYPHHFELTPAKQPNQVRFIQPPSQ